MDRERRKETNCQDSASEPKFEKLPPLRPIPKCDPPLEIPVPDFQTPPGEVVSDLIQNRFPGPILVSNEEQTATCAGNWPNNPEEGDPASGDPVVVAAGEVTGNFYFQSVLSLTSPELDYIARRSDTHAAEILAALSSADVSALSELTRLSATKTNEVIAAWNALEDSINQQALDVAISELSCQWCNEELTLTCEGDAVETEGENPVVIEAGAYCSPNSQQEADDKALVAARDLLVCRWVNEEIIVRCGVEGIDKPDLDPGETDLSTGLELGEEFPNDLLESGESGGPPHPENPDRYRANIARVAAGSFSSDQSQEAANDLATAYALTLLDCFYLNSDQTAECPPGRHEDPLVLEPGDPPEAVGNPVTVKARYLASEDSWEDADLTAMALAESLLRCVFLNREMTYSCDDLNPDPNDPDEVDAHLSDAYPGPYVLENKLGIPIYSVALEAQMEIVASPSRSGRYTVTVAAGEFDADTQEDADALAANYALSLLQCSYCNPRINPVCPLVDEDGFLPSPPFPEETDPNTMDLPIPTDMIDSRWSLDATAGIPGIFYSEDSDGIWRVGDDFFEIDDTDPPTTFVCSPDANEAIAVTDSLAIVPIAYMSPQGRNENCTYGNDRWYAACRRATLPTEYPATSFLYIPGMTYSAADYPPDEDPMEVRLPLPEGSWDLYYSPNATPVPVVVMENSYRSIDKATANEMARILASSMLDCFFESPKMRVFCGAITGVPLPDPSFFTDPLLTLQIPPEDSAPGQIGGSVVDPDSIGAYPDSGVDIAFGYSIDSRSPQNAFRAALLEALGQLRCFWRNDGVEVWCGPDPDCPFNGPGPLSTYWTNIEGVAGVVPHGDMRVNGVKVVAPYLGPYYKEEGDIYPSFSSDGLGAVPETPGVWWDLVSVDDGSLVKWRLTRVMVTATTANSQSWTSEFEAESPLDAGLFRGSHGRNVFGIQVDGLFYASDDPTNEFAYACPALVAVYPSGYVDGDDVFPVYSSNGTLTPDVTGVSWMLEATGTWPSSEWELTLYVDGVSMGSWVSALEADHPVSAGLFGDNLSIFDPEEGEEGEYVTNPDYHGGGNASIVIILDSVAGYFPELGSAVINEPSYGIIFSGELLVGDQDTYPPGLVRTYPDGESAAPFYSSTGTGFPIPFGGLSGIVSGSDEPVAFDVEDPDEPGVIYRESRSTVPQLKPFINGGPGEFISYSSTGTINPPKTGFYWLLEAADPRPSSTWILRVYRYDIAESLATWVTSVPSDTPLGETFDPVGDAIGSFILLGSFVPPLEDYWSVTAISGWPAALWELKLIRTSMISDPGEIPEYHSVVGGTWRTAVTSATPVDVDFLPHSSSAGGSAFAAAAAMEAPRMGCFHDIASVFGRVRAGEIDSFVSKDDANRQALVMARSYTDCWYVNLDTYAWCSTTGCQSTAPPSVPITRPMFSDSVENGGSAYPVGAGEQQPSLAGAIAQAATFGFTAFGSYYHNSVRQANLMACSDARSQVPGDCPGGGGGGENPNEEPGGGGEGEGGGGERKKGPCCGRKLGGSVGNAILGTFNGYQVTTRDPGCFAEGESQLEGFGAFDFFSEVVGPDCKANCRGRLKAYVNAPGCGPGDIGPAGIVAHNGTSWSRSSNCVLLRGPDDEYCGSVYLQMDMRGLTKCALCAGETTYTACGNFPGMCEEPSED